MVGATRELPAGYKRFFRALGHRIRSYRTARRLSQLVQDNTGLKGRLILKQDGPETGKWMLRSDRVRAHDSHLLA